MQPLQNLFLHELSDIFDAERQIIKVLPKMAKVSTCHELKNLILSHFSETESHLKKLDLVFKAFEVVPRRHTCKATEGLLTEFNDIIEEFKGSRAINSAIVSVAQKIDHYEIASLGCLHEWAELLKNKTGATLLKEILEVEKKANLSLTTLARSRCNPDALESSHKKTGEKC